MPSARASRSLVARADWRRPEEYPESEDLTDTLWAWQFLRRNAAYQDDWEAESKGRARAWGLVTLVDPAIREPKGLRFILSFGQMIIGEWNSELYVPAGDVYYRFDIQKPLRPQMHKAEDDLKIVQDMEPKIGTIQAKRFSRRHRRTWPRFLRLLDAAAISTSREEIAKRLYPDLPEQKAENEGQKAVHRDLKRAIEIARNDYKNLLP